jgi:mono/diheme cytochrome c family protein
MKKFTPVIGTILFMIYASTAFGEVVIKTAPLDWRDINNMGGDEVFDELCAVCHGIGGKGDGPAISALDKGAPDLTVLAASNGGMYPHRDVENMIYGSSRTITHGTIDMPPWGEQFMYAGPGTFPRQAYARKQVQALTTHIESLQIELSTEGRLANK